ncbi:MAG: RAMP superfamily CRISPR-associated protein [Acidobacteria bacterium]|nr:RAMP superfamily CRISPR-associated protein [Acidobacteriota bacterium]
MATKLMRAALRPLYEAGTNPHPGLLLQRGLAEHDDDPGIKAKHVERICRSTASDFYRRAYARWTQATADTTRFRSVNLKLKTRLFIGLTGGGMLETGCAISRPHGTPYIPGSSVKGVVAAHALERLDGTGDTFRELFGARPTEDRPDAMSGLIVFHDAWWAPGSAERPLVKEVVTTHHPAYYAEEGATPATDFDSPVPNAQVAAQGAFLFVVEGPTNWLDFAQRMLVSALTTSGAGAKTRAGYGLFATPEGSGAPPGPGRKWVVDTVAELTAKPGVQRDQALRGKALADAWSSIDDAMLKRAALAEIRARWQERGWWDNPQGGAARKAKAIYDAWPAGQEGAS